MKTSALRLALAVALFSVATHAFSQDGGLYLSAGMMATFAGPQDFEVGAKPAENADFTAIRKGHRHIRRRHPRLPCSRGLPHLRLSTRG